MTDQEFHAIHERNKKIFAETQALIKNGKCVLTDREMCEAIFLDDTDIERIQGDGFGNLTFEETKTNYAMFDGGTTTAALSFLHHHHKRVLVLNYASSTHPGGGVRRGARAQEETLCRQTTLLCSLESAAARPFYDKHRALGDYHATDAMILSPKVELLRDDSYSWVDDVFDEPPVVAALTCAAPHIFSNTHDTPESLGDLYYQRIFGMLCAAAKYGYRNLVLGAWGCGAFHNDPELVADAFCRALMDIKRNWFGGKDFFETVFFAIPDKDSVNYKVFEKRVSEMNRQLAEEEEKQPVEKPAEEISRTPQSKLCIETEVKDEDTFVPWHKLEEAIKRCADNEYKDNQEVLAVLLRGLEGGQRVILPIDMNEEAEKVFDPAKISVGDTVKLNENVRFTVQHITTKDGQRLAVAFTGMDEVNKGQPTSVITMPLFEVLRMAAEEKDSTGLVINPWENPYTLPKAMVEQLWEYVRPYTQAERDLDAGADAYQRGEYQKAIRLFERAAANGSTVAMSNLGYCYYYGRSIPVDKEKARQYWEKAAIFGNVNAIYKLGDMYRNGDLPEDLVFSEGAYIKAFNIANEERDINSYPDACLRFLKYCLDPEAKEKNREIAQGAVDGFYKRMKLGDEFAAPLYREALELKDRLEREGVI